MSQKSYCYIIAAIFLIAVISSLAVAQAPTPQEQLAAQYKLVKMGSDTGGYSVVEKGTLLNINADTVAAMGRNAIGNLGVPALKSALPARSDDFSFIADGRDKWGLGFLITVDEVKGKRSAGSLSWGGIYNTYFWIDRTRGIGGVILTQFLPFADRKALALYDGFERGVYQLADAVR